MKEPGRLQPVIFIVVVTLALFCAQQTTLAQRSGSLPYPPPKSNQASRPYSPPGTDTSGGGTAFDRSGSTGNPETRMLRRRAATELAEDFERLGRLNREKIRPFLAASTVDYQELYKVTGEINNRARRIKSNSPIELKDKKGDKSDYEFDAARLRSVIPELGRLIDTFLGNPVFHTASPRDDELRSNAGRDLESIIRLSGKINRIAKRMAKS